VGFWARFREGDEPVEWAITIVAYSAAVGVVLFATQRWSIARAGGLIIAGAMYGWIIEGAIATTLYSSPPFSVVWTGVAWHGLITVGVGWWLLPRAVNRGGWPAALTCAAVGVAWGVWSAQWWGALPEIGEATAYFDPAGYAGFVVLVSALGAAGYAAQRALAPASPPAAWAGWACVACVVAWFVVVVALQVNWAPVLLAPLVALALLRMKMLSSVDSVAPRWSVPTSIQYRRLPWLALIPMTAVAAYCALAPLEPAVAGEGVLTVTMVATVIVLTAAGAVALGVGLWGPWSFARPRTHTASPVGDGD